jgi:hypothetical protein
MSDFNESMYHLMFIIKGQHYYNGIGGWQGDDPSTTCIKTASSTFSDEAVFMLMCSSAYPLFSLLQ